MKFQGTPLAEFEKSPGQVIKIHQTEFRGKQLIDIRLFLAPGNQHTFKGINIPLEKLPDLLIAVNEAAEKAYLKKRGKFSQVRNL